MMNYYYAKEYNEKQKYHNLEKFQNLMAKPLFLTHFLDLILGTSIKSGRVKLLFKHSLIVDWHGGATVFRMSV